MQMVQKLKLKKQILTAQRLWKDLPFTSLKLSWVYVDSFEQRKPKLTGCSLVRVRSRNHNWHLKVSEQFQSCSRLVIGCTIPIYEGISPPVPVALVELLHQTAYEQKNRV
jgi:hypothetical protein